MAAKPCFCPSGETCTPADLEAASNYLSWQGDRLTHNRAAIAFHDRLQANDVDRLCVRDSGDGTEYDWAQYAPGGQA